jgi:hypothetical protein
LGIYFDTINLTRSLPEEKKTKTIITINDIRSQKMASTLQIQSITGRLNFIFSMCPVLNGFKFNLNKALATAITNGLASVDNTLLEDLRIWHNFLTYQDKWLPTPHEKQEPPLACINFWTDAAGFTDNSSRQSDRGCGVYSSDIDENTILGYQPWWPKKFIMEVRDNSNKCFGNKTTTLEMITILLPLLLIPFRLRNATSVSLQTTWLAFSG